MAREKRKVMKRSNRTMIRQQGRKKEERQRKVKGRDRRKGERLKEGRRKGEKTLKR